MTPASIQQLAEQALALSEKATKGPWNADSQSTVVRDQEGEPIAVTVRGPRSNWDELECDENGKFIAASRQSLPLLAQAVLKLMPHVRHWYNNENGEGCAHYIDEREPCDCGLDAALAGMEEKT